MASVGGGREEETLGVGAFLRVGCGGGGGGGGFRNRVGLGGWFAGRALDRDWRVLVKARLVGLWMTVDVVPML